MTAKRALAALCLLFVVFLGRSHASGMKEIRSQEVVVVFSGPLGNAAREVLDAYPRARNRLEHTLRWRAAHRPTVLLTDDRASFELAAGSAIVAAYAVPGNNLIVLDNSKVHAGPLALGTTLTHELCHLALHNQITRTPIPRWLDEGVCQWASGGASEIVFSMEAQELAKASLSHRLIGLEALSDSFPDDAQSLRLAYAESLSVVQYIVRKYGDQRLLEMLGYMKDGLDADRAARESLSVSIHGLETGWRGSLSRRHTWVAYLSDNVYLLLFALGGVLTILGFIRFLLRKRAYRDEEEEI
jgi:hypothetical protein